MGDLIRKKNDSTWKSFKADTANKIIVSENKNEFSTKACR